MNVFAGRRPIALLRSFFRMLLKHLIGAESPSFPGSAAYWERRYKQGQTSGDGSYGKLAVFKAAVVNEIITDKQIGSVVDFGCGDGNQLQLMRMPCYLGLDVSRHIIEKLRKEYESDPDKEFLVYPDDMQRGIRADLSLSMDVIYHLVEDSVFERYMEDLFAASRRYVLIYSSNSIFDLDPRPHVKDRVFTDFVSQRFPEWRLVRTVPNPYKPESRSDFYLFESNPGF